MNADSPKTPREELEARLTALLLGELSADEAAAVHRALAQDAELARLHDRLQATIGLVREAAATQAEPATGQPPLKLSDDRREKLLAHFQTVPLLPKLTSDQKAKRSWLIPMSVAVALVALLGIAALVPNFVRARNTSQANAVLNNMRQLENAKQLWAEEHKKSGSDAPTFDDLKPYLRGGNLHGAAHTETRYALGKVAEPVTVEMDAKQSKGRFGISEGRPDTSGLDTKQTAEMQLPANQAKFAASKRDPAAGTLPTAGLAYRTWSAENEHAKAFVPEAQSDRRRQAEVGQPLPAHETPSTPAIVTSESERTPASAAPASSVVVDSATVVTPPPASRPTSTIVLPSLGEPTDGAKSADANYAVAGREGAGVLAQPDQAHSEANRFVSRYAYEAKPTGDDVLAAAKPESWYFGNGAGSKSDSSVRTGGQAAALWDISAVSRGFYSDGSAQDLFAKDTSLNRDQFGRNQESAARGRGTVTAGQAVTGLPQQTVNGVAASGLAAGDDFYGGYAMKSPTPPPSVKLEGFSEIRGERKVVVLADGDANGDKTFALGDTPELGKRFYRVTGGVGGVGDGAQAQPLPPPASPAPQADSSVAGLAITAPKGVELVPFQPQLPAPTLKGRPEQLPSSPNIEPLGTRPSGTVVLGQPEATQVALDPELRTAFRRRYGLDSAAEQLVAGASKKSEAAAAASPPAQQTATPKYGVAVANPTAAAEGKEARGVSALDRDIPVRYADSQDISENLWAVARRPLGSTESAGVGGATAINAGNLELFADAPEADRKRTNRFAEGDLRERYVYQGKYYEDRDTGNNEPRDHSHQSDLGANILAVPEGGRIAPAEKVHSLDVADYSVATGVSKGVARVAAAEALGRQPSSIVLPPAETGPASGVERAKTEELARAEIAPMRPSSSPARSESAQLVQDGKLLLELGKTETAEKKFKEAIKAEPENRSADYYLDLAKDARRRQSVRKREADTKTALVGVEQALAVSSAEKSRKLDDAIAKAQAQVDDLRTSLAMSDADASGAGPSPLLEAETLRRLEGLRIESEARYVKEAKMLQELKDTPQERLKDVLPTAVQDPQLNALNQRLGSLEREKERLGKDATRDRSSLAAVNQQIQDTENKLAERTEGITKGLETRVASLKQHLDSLNENVEKAKQEDRAKAQKSRPYFEAKLKLEELMRFRSMLNMKLASEKIDLDIPRTTMVEVVDRAQPAQKKTVTFGGLLAGNYTSSARVRVERDVADIMGMGSEDASNPVGYDPYFTQTEFEVIQSERVLSNVVQELGLESRWGKESAGGRKLTAQEAMTQLRGKLDLKPVKGTSLIEIRTKSDDPQEAANIANAVAQTYRDYRLGQRRQLTQGGIRALEDRFDEQEKKVQQAQAEVDRLRTELTVGNQPVGSTASARTNLNSASQRQAIIRKLQGIRMDGTIYEGLPLAEVIHNLNNEIKKQDPQKQGINLVLNPETESPEVDSLPVIDPTTGLPISPGPSEPVDIAAVAVNLDRPLKNACLADILDAVVRAADTPIKYSIEKDGIVFSQDTDRKLPIRKPSTNAPIPQPEVQTSDNAFSTFSLNVSDVAFKLAAASLEKGQMPDAASVRTEEFINAFDYRDPEAPPGVPIAFAWERARYPFAHNRDLLRFSLKTAAAGRQAGRSLNLVLLLDNSGSMERADRVQIIREALRVLAGQLQPQDKLSVITFARTPRLWVDGVAGDKSGEVLDQVGGLTPQGGTNLEEAMNLAYATALRHYLAGGINRVVLLTDGAANLGNVEPEPLKQKVEAHRQQGIALDCFGIGWEGFNDDLLEVLSRNGDGRYGFINSPDEAATEFAGQLAGALQVAASDVKVQVEFNPKRVTAYRQIGYAKHQLTKEQFRDNTVDAAEIAAQEAGNALYTVEVNPAGEGPLCIVRCRFKIPGTTDYREHEWAVPYSGNAVSLEQSSPAMRLAASASAFAEWLVVSPFAAEVTPDALLGYLSDVPEVYGADARPKKLEWMIRQAKSLAGR